MSEALLVESPPKKLADPPRLVADKPATLLDLLDRLLDKGVAISGRVMIGIADIDLIYLNLKVLLSSVETVEREAKGSFQNQKGSDPHPIRGEAPSRGQTPIEVVPFSGAAPGPGEEENRDSSFVIRDSKTQPLPTTHYPLPTNQSRATTSSPLASFFSSPSSISQPHGKLRIDPKRAQKDMAKLLLTVAELLRRLMERQGIKRMDGGSLNAWQIEQLGVGLMALENTMRDLKKSFGLKDEDLNLDLGPLGELM